MIKKIVEDNRLILHVSGRIDSANASAFGRKLQEQRNANPDMPVEIDAEELEYISSAGLREVLSLYKKEKSLKIINVSEEVYEIFYITGFTDFLDIEKAEKLVEVVEGINDTDWDYDFIAPIRMFEECVKENPDKLAVVSEDRNITYGQLNDEANRIANYLQFVGIRPDDLVMILLPRGIDTYVANLGILKAGGAYIIASVDYPDERIQYMFENAKCRYLITTHDICFDRLDLIVDLKRRPLFFENIVTYEDASQPKQRIDKRDLAYCIYTSGSTGKPKGVLIEQDNLANFLHHNPKNFETMGIVERGNVVLAVSPSTFDFSIMEQFIPLTSGQTVALASRAQIMNPLLMKDFMDEYKVDAVMGTPSYIDTLLTLPQLKETMSRIQVYDFGAEAFPGVIYNKITALNPDAHIMNGYGPTEATISCTMKVIDSPENITIGIPNANVHVYVVDENNQEVEDGVIGELLVSGRGVGRGYMQLPEKTSEVFIDFNGERAYKTGDLVKITEDGEIEYHGRRDNQVKLHGLRIELGEIEETMMKCEGISSCVASVIDGKYMCFYYVPAGDFSQDQVKAYAKDHLAHYMIPDLYECLDEMPLTANMKIDRKALPRPNIQKREYIAPQNAVQETLAKIISEVVPDEEFGIDTEIFELGVSSIDIIILLAMIGDEYQVVLKAADIYNNPTIAQMETMLETAPKIGESQKKDKYFCTLTQMGDFQTWATHNGPSMLIPVLSELHPSIDNDRLCQAIRTAISAHPILSARFVPENGMVYQIPCENVLENYQPEIIQISEKKFDSMREQLANEFFELTDYPLFRFRIYETESKKYMYAAFNHILGDGESIAILFEDIAAAYEGKEITPERMTMFDVGEEHMKYMNSTLFAQCIGYYTKLMQGRSNWSSIPMDSDNAELQAGFKERLIPIDKDMIKEKCLQMGITENILFAGTLGIVAAAMANEEDAAFALGYNGRNDSRLSNTFGCLAGITMVRCMIEKNASLKEYLNDLHKQFITASAYPMVPYQQMAENYTGFLDMVYIYQPHDSDDFTIDGTIAKTEYMSDSTFSEASKLTVQAHNKKEGFLFTCDYHANRYLEETMESFLDKIETVLSIFEGESKLQTLMDAIR